MGEPEKDKIVLSLGQVTAFQFSRLLSLSILVSKIINFPRKRILCTDSLDVIKSTQSMTSVREDLLIELHHSL